jgi:hypothetical protein
VKGVVGIRALENEQPRKEFLQQGWPQLTLGLC